MIKIDLQFLLDSPDSYKTDIALLRRKSSSAISCNSSNFGSFGSNALMAESLKTHQDNPLKRTRSCSTVHQGLIFHFGGYDGKNYFSDIQVYVNNSLLEQAFGIPCIETLHKMMRKKEIFNFGPHIKLRHPSGTFSFSKYWLSIRMKSSDHPFSKLISSQYSIGLETYDSDTIEDTFKCIINGLWPSRRSSLELLISLKIKEEDLIPHSETSMLIDRMESMDQMSSCCTSIDGGRSLLYVDADWLAQSSGFFSEYLSFPSGTDSKITVQAMNANFKAFLKLQLQHQFDLGYSGLRVADVCDAFDAADYLVCPLVNKVGYCKSALHQAPSRFARDYNPHDCKKVRRGS
jgi:hypothetical protein